MKDIIVTGSSGLIGSEVVRYFHTRGFKVHGIDNNQRAQFFGPSGDTRWSQSKLISDLRNFVHHELDIRNRDGIFELIKCLRPQAIIHAASQPSHDRAADIPFEDFETNALGTLNLLESARRYCLDAPFIYLSTNKVYGDRPNKIKLIETDLRWDFSDSQYINGISENCSIDQSKHSLFGASKLAGDVLVQEYGRYFNMPTCCLRGGCLTGPSHSGVELHGFLSYLIKCNIESREYKIFGYKGKQVRDNIHSEDVASFIYSFFQAPRCAEVYNLGGGKENSCSILEAFEIAENYSGKKQLYKYVSEHRVGDHICYYSDLTKIKEHYPKWSLSKSLNVTIKEIVNSWQSRLHNNNYP